MKKLASEFKEFISKGNVIDMAVGLIIGSAFTAIVSSLVGDILSPLIGILTGKVNLTGLSVQVGDATLTYGNFIQAIITFLLTALAVFFLIKGINGLRSIGKKKHEEAPAAPETKICPHCMSEINIKATRCPHCTSELED